MENKSLTEEQKKFVKSIDDFLIVSAGPGSGKTHTIIHYLKEKIINAKKEIVTCSFTRNSSNEIKKRFKNYNDLNINIKGKFSFQTFDSFLIIKIWKYYFNRILKYTISKYQININTNYKLFQKSIIYSKVLWKSFNQQWKKDGNKKWLVNEIKEFVDYAIEEKLLIGFISEYILLQFIKENEEIKKYIISNFERIIIDEAQDLSCLRYEILIELHRIGIKLTLVGDERQTIYKYLGAKDRVFDWLQEEYKDFKIEKIILKRNFRYNGKNNNIKRILETKDEKNFKSMIKKSIENKDIDSFYINNYQNGLNFKKNEKYLFLTKTNKAVEEISSILKKMKVKHRAILKLPKEIKISFEEQIFIENLFLYHLLEKEKISKNQIKSNIVDEICNFIWPYDPKSNDKFLKLFWDKKKKFEEKISIIEKMKKIKQINEVIKLFDKNKNYINNFPQDNIQIMTFHGSKGLEAENIFINSVDVKEYLEKSYNAPTFQEIFVAFSRVKNKIILLEL